MARLKEKYTQEIKPNLQKKLGLSNVMEVPKIKKITLNMGVGEAVQDKKIVEKAIADIERLSGQKALITRAKKSVASFKVREGMPIGAKVTLRSERMYEFLDRLINVALPRVRDFRGLNRKSFDGNGNYSLGVKEQIIFPEIDYDKVDKIRGLDICITTSAKDDEECLALLKEFNFPIKDASKNVSSDQPEVAAEEVVEEAAVEEVVEEAAAEEVVEEAAAEDKETEVEEKEQKQLIGSPDLVICLDSGAGNYEQFWLTTSLRGLIGCTLRVDILNEGIHSGGGSGIVPSSFRIARQLLSRIEDENTGMTKLDSFSVDIPQERLTQAKETISVLGDEFVDAFPWVKDSYPVLQDPVELLLNNTWRSMLSVTGADGLPSIEDSGNVLRPYTALKLSLRLPPTLKAEKAQLLLENLFKESIITLA